MSGSTGAPPPEQAPAQDPLFQTPGGEADLAGQAADRSQGETAGTPDTQTGTPSDDRPQSQPQDAAGSDASGEPEGDTPGEASPPTSRAGRNLPAAIAVGVLLVAIALASLYWQLWLFVVLVVVAIVMGTAELASAVATRGITLSRIPLLIAAITLPVVGYTLGPDSAFMAFGLLFLFTLVWRLFKKGTENFVRDATASSFVLAYAPLMGAFAALIAASPDGADRVLTFIVLSVASDIGGYAAGVLFGKHPMAPSISPKKSWEGFAGSVTLQVILGAVLFVVLLDSDWWKGVIVGAVMTVTATLGDFLESAIKRDMGIKDMSNVLPGHGGVMDRLDSLIPNTVVAYTLFALTLGGIS
jgi:phosphatidate cytidylyltransferase